MKSWLVTAALLATATTPASAQSLFGAKPAELTTTYKTEHAWAAGESIADIAEMSAAARGAARALTAPAGIKPWNPDQLVPFASEAFGPAAAKPSATTPVAHYAALADLTPAAIVRAGDAVSSVLRRDMRNVPAHESAVLVLGAFALREAADDLTDVRWALNRMTAHLAVADALRPRDATVSLDGQLGRVAFLALANRTTTAMTALDAIGDRPADARLMAWKRALRMRLTHDWRLSTLPAGAVRVEKLEYFRARRKTLANIRAGQELTGLAEPVAIDFARIVQSSRHGVEDSNTFVEPAIAGELGELFEVYRLMHGRDLPETLPAAIVNVRAGRLMTGGAATVLPWGAWAEFFQRHAGMCAGEIDDRYRNMLGLPARADEFKRKVDALLGHLTLFPVFSARRTRGEGTEADLTHINAAIALAARAPELVTYNYWTFLMFGSRYEMVMQGMPDASRWFLPLSAEVPYDAGWRSRGLLGQLATPDVEALVAEASSEVNLAARALAPRPAAQAMRARIFAWLKARAAFDLYAIDVAFRWSQTREEQIEWRRYGCSLSIYECLRLASMLAFSGDEAGAVREYERAFRDPQLDQVWMANSASWLVSYYERTAQLPRAEDLARRAGEAYSATGLQTLAGFYERRGRISEAGGVYENLVKRYPRSRHLLAGFLYRQAVVAKNPIYAERWRALEKALFPSGMQALPAEMADSPEAGVWVDEVGGVERRLRVQVGDIIVGVDGWRVESREQYRALMAFTEPHVPHKITLWRGVLFSVDLPDDNGLELETYPLRGWIR